MRGLWQFTAVCAVLGGLVILMAIGAEGAPQQAAGAAIGVGMAVAPYVYTRAIQEMGNSPPPKPKAPKMPEHDPRQEI